jgi:hypothetical protein
MDRRLPPQQPAHPDPKKTAEESGDPLDEALEETFPSSDPVSVSVPEKEAEWTPEELAEAERRKRASQRNPDRKPS